MAGSEHRGAIEAILFSCGEPVSSARIAEVIGIDTKSVNKILLTLSVEYANRESGICIVKLGDSWQMTSSKDYAAFVRSALDLRRNQPLSQAALEVLAIIAYNQPVTKAFMEQIRGVDCSGVVATLCEKELVEEAGRLDLPGRPIAYKTTLNFMRAFGLSSLEELPALPKEAIPAEVADSLLNPDNGFIPEKSSEEEEA